MLDFIILCGVTWYTFSMFSVDVPCLMNSTPVGSRLRAILLKVAGDLSYPPCKRSDLRQTVPPKHMINYEGVKWFKVNFTVETLHYTTEIVGCIPLGSVIQHGLIKGTGESTLVRD